MQYKGNAEALSQIMVIFNRYVNNNTWPPEFLWAGHGASGSYRVDKTGDAEYSVEISVTFDDGSFAYVNYDGPCISVDYVRTEPEVTQ